jgi:F-type H+-transporting ATPase subunit b
MVSLAEGFGFNTNILETNILNLAVVIPVVFSLGKDTLSSILDNRREKILTSLRSADDRFKQAQMELDEAKSEFDLALEKVKEIQTEGQKALEMLAVEGKKRNEEVETRFANLKEETVRLEEEKAVSAIRQQIISLAFDKAVEMIQSYMTPPRHRKYIDQSITLMSSSLMK